MDGHGAVEAAIVLERREASHVEFVEVQLEGGEGEPRFNDLFRGKVFLGGLKVH